MVCKFRSPFFSVESTRGRHLLSPKSSWPHPWNNDLDKLQHSPICSNRVAGVVMESCGKSEMSTPRLGGTHNKWSVAHINQSLHLPLAIQNKKKSISTLTAECTGHQNEDKWEQDGPGRYRLSAVVSWQWALKRVLMSICLCLMHTVQHCGVLSTRQDLHSRRAFPSPPSLSSCPKGR